jgi:hypothetical protein
MNIDADGRKLKAGLARLCSLSRREKVPRQRRVRVSRFEALARPPARWLSATLSLRERVPQLQADPVPIG